jgi:hypothetical protein
VSGSLLLCKAHSAGREERRKKIERNVYEYIRFVLNIIEQKERKI